jgi:uncharacterized protein (DUF2141 family)
MKTLLITSALVAALFATATTASAIAPPTATVSTVTSVTEPATYKLTVTFSNVNTRKGKIYVGLANDADSFDGSSFRKARVEVPATGEISVSFESLPAGKYAVRVYQDVNENEKFDRSGQMPAEPFGFSNVKMLMGPPDFTTCAFDLNENKSINISIIEM